MPEVVVCGAPRGVPIDGLYEARIGVEIQPLGDLTALVIGASYLGASVLLVQHIGAVESNEHFLDELAFLVVFF
jgi:hypothetical protein